VIDAAGLHGGDVMMTAPHPGRGNAAGCLFVLLHDIIH
jgi:hypothetical protein